MKKTPNKMALKFQLRGIVKPHQCEARVSWRGPRRKK
jgi:hypothetical protein